MHALAHQLNCNFWHSFEGASTDVCLPDASFLEDKVEGSLCGSKGEEDANANSFNLDLLACVSAAASLNNDNDERGGSAFLQKLSLLLTQISIPLLMEMMMIQCLALIRWIVMPRYLRMRIWNLAWSMRLKKGS